VHQHENGTAPAIFTIIFVNFLKSWLHCKCPL
jgi:hypothetical protein